MTFVPPSTVVPPTVDAPDEIVSSGAVTPFSSTSVCPSGTAQFCLRAVVTGVAIAWTCAAAPSTAEISTPRIVVPDTLLSSVSEPLPERR